MSSFNEDLKQNEAKLEERASYVIDYAKKLGADECSVGMAGYQGLSVSSRDAEVENVEFSKSSGLGITVYKDHKKGSASTTDLSTEALHNCVQSALAIASYSNPDEFAGIAEKELLCTEFKDLDLVSESKLTADDQVQFCIELEQMALDKKAQGIKKTDGADFNTGIYTGVFANSNGYCKASSSTFSVSSLVLLGEDDSKKMYRGYSSSIGFGPDELFSKERIVNEAIEKTQEKLNAHPVKTGVYNVIFHRNMVSSLWMALFGAISGGNLFRRRSFLCDSLNTQILNDYVTIHEDPFLKHKIGSRNSDGEGVRVKPCDIVKDGVLKEYLLGCYSARKLGMKSNGHASGTANIDISFGKDHTVGSFDELLKQAGEGFVITSLMGQGLDIISGNFSYGATGYYFKNGVKVHAVNEITIAGNLKDMLKNLALVAEDLDDRPRMINCGSVLIPNMTVSGT